MLTYYLTGDLTGHRTLSVFTDSQGIRIMDDSNPSFAKVLGLLTEPDTNEARVLAAFDLAEQVRARLEAVSDDVRVAGGHVLYKGEVTETGVGVQILRLMEEGSDVAPMVHFLEKIEENPSQNSRTQAWEWLNRHGFTITVDGNIIAYKGVDDGDTPGTYRSRHAGKAAVDGVEHVGYIPNAVGNTVTMPRSRVADNPSDGCSDGLHVGTYGYAQGYAGGALLKVSIDPADIVSVPNDSSYQKMRVCAYTVEEIIEQEITTALDLGDDQ